MGEGSPEAFAAAFRWLGVEAQPTPPSDVRTRELGGKYTTGDECYPAKVTVGDFLRVIEQPGFDAERAAFFMPTAEGPCRFGQYAPFLRKILRDAGYGDVKVVSPTSRNGYVPAHSVARTRLRRQYSPGAVEDPPL
jgi:predicted nucleotide-binding protein (sugar kinase/HSP70/actin superfamily)